MSREPSERKVIEDILMNSHLFKSLDEQGRNDLIDLGEIIQADTGSPIITEGSDGECFFVLIKGKVEVSADKKGRSVILAELGSGAIVGEVALLTGEPRTATVTACKPCTLVSFAEPSINEILERYPKLKELLVRVLVHRAKDTIEKLLSDMAVS